MKFSQYLELKFLEWQRNEGGRKTVKEFAGFIGVSQSTISSWWNGIRVPEGENIRKLEKKLGFEVYDVLGLPRPDEDLAYISQHWDTISAEFRRKFRKEVEEQLDNEQSKRVPKSRRTHAGG